MRKYLASEAISLGREGITEVSAISGIHRNTISIGIKELNDPNYVVPDHVNNTTRIRKPGGGRKSIVTIYPDIIDSLERLVDPETYGNPENPLRWTTKSLRRLAEELQKGEKVQLVGFGTFEVSERAEREGRNPQTGETMKIAACKAPKFKAGKALKDAINA